MSIGFPYFATLVGAGQAHRLAARAGLTDCRDAPPAVLDLATFWRLCAENILALNDESHGIAPEPVAQGSLSVLIMAAKDGDSLAEASERLVAAAALVRKECQLTLGKSRAGLHLTIRPLATDPRAEIYIECFALVVHCAFRWMTGRALAPVRLRGPSGVCESDGSVLSSFHMPVIRHGSGVTISYGPDDIAAPILAQKYKAWGAAEFQSFLDLLAETPQPARWDGQVRDRVCDLMRCGLHGQDEIAAALRLSRATLRRRLADEGTSFRALAGEFRTGELRQLLASDVSLSDAAQQIGLSDERSLRRLCQAKLGLSPSKYRQRLRRAG